MVRKYVRKWLPSILAFMVALLNRLAVLRRWISVVNLYMRMRINEEQLVQLTGQVDEIAAHVDGAAVGARQAAQYLVNGRKGELNEQERRVAEMLRAAESVAGVITTAGSDLVVELQQWTRDSKREREAAGDPYREGAGFTYNPTTGSYTKPNGKTGYIDPNFLRECHADPTITGCPSRYAIEQLYKQLPDNQVQ